MILTSCKEASDLLNSGRATKAVFRPDNLPLASGEMLDAKQILAGQLGLQAESIVVQYSEDDPAYVWLEDGE